MGFASFLCKPHNYWSSYRRRDCCKSQQWLPNPGSSTAACEKAFGKPEMSLQAAEHSPRLIIIRCSLQGHWNSGALKIRFDVPFELNQENNNTRNPPNKIKSILFNSKMNGHLPIMEEFIIAMKNSDAFIGV